MTVRAWEILRAVRGPILLITFGVLMALSHTDVLEFHRSFPILIIVYGLLKLAERMIGRPMPPPPAWPPAGQAYPYGTPHAGAPPVQPYTPQPQQFPAQPYPPQTPQGGAQ